MRQVPLLLCSLLLVVGCSKAARPTPTILLGGTYNTNNKCVGHAQGLCGTEDEMLPTEIAGVFATQSDCEGVRLRGLTEKERTTASNQLPLLLDVFYEGSSSVSYMGTGKGETQGWMFMFNGPRGHFSAKARTEQELVRRVCKAAKGLGADIDSSVGCAK